MDKALIPPKTKFRFSTRELGFRANQLLLKHKKLAFVAMREVRNTVLKAAIDRCPKKEGILRNCLTGDVEEYGKSYAATVYIPTGSPASHYAVWIHEGEYNLGPLSQALQEKTGIKIGPKYITRAVMDTREDIIKNLEKALNV
jgi:hypothetical protein